MTNFKEKLKETAAPVVKLLAVGGVLLFGATEAQAGHGHGHGHHSEGAAIAHGVAHGIHALGQLIGIAQGNPVVVGGGPAVVAPVVTPAVVTPVVTPAPVVPVVQPVMTPGGAYYTGVPPVVNTAGMDPLDALEMKDAMIRARNAMRPAPVGLDEVDALEMKDAMIRGRNAMRPRGGIDSVDALEMKDAMIRVRNAGR